MDAHYFDLYVKYRNVEHETLWSRAMTKPEITYTIQMMLVYIEGYQKLHEGVSPINYIRIE